VVQRVVDVLSFERDASHTTHIWIDDRPFRATRPWRADCSIDPRTSLNNVRKQRATGKFFSGRSQALKD
jgi:hypothetical protein